jgi:hypothetical protein
MTASNASGSRAVAQAAVSAAFIVPPVSSWNTLEVGMRVSASRSGCGMVKSWAVMKGIACFGAVRRASRVSVSRRLRTVQAAVQARFPSITSLRPGSSAMVLPAVLVPFSELEPAPVPPLRSGSVVGW